ncbi:hypothetical protein C1H46_010028 [Malus baccata]|uniref:Uncharacterized protein n=1 Tax=Malus baccata TaxID=106549 RepID=A0A540N086_MALBA|nr:hypothetical protein C1H46_010028 [Malus baccata]
MKMRTQSLPLRGQGRVRCHNRIRGGECEACHRQMQRTQKQSLTTKIATKTNQIAGHKNGIKNQEA